MGKRDISRRRIKMPFTETIIFPTEQEKKDFSEKIEKVRIKIEEEIRADYDKLQEEREGRTL